MGVLKFIPVLTIPIAIYALIAMTNGAHTVEALAQPMFSFPVASGDHMTLSLGALVTIVAILCLFFEVIGSAIPSKSAIVGNMSTAILLVICIGVFLLVRGFGTTEFFLITLLLLLDYLTDSTIMVFTSRRTVEYNRN